MRLRVLPAVLLTASVAGALLAASPVEEARKATRAEQAKACEIARWAAAQTLAGKPPSAPPSAATGVLAKPLPCFVTISVDGRRKACMGSFQPQHKTLAANIVASAARAVKLDRRAGGLTADQLKRAAVHVTVTGERRRVEDLSGYPPANYGLMVEKGAKSAVLLPGEAKTTRWQLAEAKRQAGIGPGETVTAYVFRAVTFGEGAR